MATFKVELVKERETKGAVLYYEKLANGHICSAPNDLGAKVGTQYVRKDAFLNGQIPDRLIVTYEY